MVPTFYSQFSMPANEMFYCIVFLFMYRRELNFPKTYFKDGGSLGNDYFDTRVGYWSASYLVYNLPYIHPTTTHSMKDMVIRENVAEYQSMS